MVSGLTAFLALLLSSVWAGISRSSTDSFIRSQLMQEMDLAVSSFSRDLGGAVAVASSSANLRGKQQGRWVGYLPAAGSPAASTLRLCYDGGDAPNGTADWASPDTVVEYRLESYTDNYNVASNMLVRQLNPDAAGTKFTVATNVDSMTIDVSDGAYIKIQLTFKYKRFSDEYTRKCTLIAKGPT